MEQEHEQQMTLTTVAPTELAESSRDPVFDLIAAAATDSRVDATKLQALFGLKQQVEADEARKQFVAAFSAMAAEMPRVSKDGKIDKITKEGVNKGTIPFATWENVDAVIRPILQKFGFSLSFRTRMDSTGEIMTAVLAHVGGHSETSETRVKPDAGPGRNDTQAWGSGRSYTKRYLTLDLLNIVTVKQDDDGRAAGHISEQQANSIYDFIAELELPDARRKSLLKMFHVGAVEEIQTHQLDAVMALLRQEQALKKAGVKR